MEIKEISWNESVLSELVALSKQWETEDISYGYVANQPSDIEGQRIWIAIEKGKIIGYLFGKASNIQDMSSVMGEEAPCFVVEELYVTPAFRSKGIGAALFRKAEGTVKDEADYLVLGTSTKNWKAILHFYIDEMGMDFHSARLFKKL